MSSFERYWTQGRFSRQAHRDLPEGTYEREVGRDGFDGPASHIYHPRPPTDWDSIEGPLRPRAYDLNRLEKVTHPLAALPLFESESLTLSYWRTRESMSELARDADGDVLLFVHAGNLHFFCDFGHLDVSEGKYLVIPRGTMWRFETQDEASILILQTRGMRFTVPNRGLLGRHALWDPAVLAYPKLDEEFKQQDQRRWSVKVNRRRQISTINYAHNPLDAVGWKGDAVPILLDIHDILPVNSHRYHLPPSAHATFECDAAIVSTFVPRPFETDTSALKVPFFHNNDDIDEVIFYHAGDFFSRDSIEKGCLTYHPSGLTHGPHPNALTRMFEQEAQHTNEYAVMIDAREQLDPVNQSEAEDAELMDYVNSWRASHD